MYLHIGTPDRRSRPRVYLHVGTPDRRSRPRGGPDGEPSRPQLVSMILGSYREMPGLCLHTNQAVRLFGMRAQTCQIVLEDLVYKGRLRRAHDGQYLSGQLDMPIANNMVLM
jgi:hypothetical protein